ncbi:uncharacterized protein [Clytia hemisphaerica]|uniref:uncharacterized protein isoform X2 n=1 Tax=Clytia hemisphaerica TaxID=252671 RepID=UPI0034D7679B
MSIFRFAEKCTVDADCEANECCTPTLSMGDRCRGHMTEGTICSSFTEELIKRLHRRCPCEAGTSCKRTGSILGIYKINRCVKDEA